MEDVDRGGTPRGERGEASDDPGLGRVRLHDVWPERSDLGPHERERPEVGDRVRRPAQALDLGTRERPGPQLELVGLVDADPSRQQ